MLVLAGQHFFNSILQIKESEEEVAANFLELIQTLLKDPEERRDFFSVRQRQLLFSCCRLAGGTECLEICLKETSYNVVFLSG